MPEVLGHVDDGWGKVADAFRSNLEDHDLGAAFCAEVGGRRVVDVWGGVADARTGRPWQEDTIAVVFSVTKGAVAICANRLVERGELDLDEPVATYWPEFAAHGKGAIPVRWLLTHQAGLPVVDVPLTVQDVCAWYPVIRALEAQRPLWEPGSRHAYHAHTFGFLVGEVVRRAHGRTVGAMFAGDVARPLGLSAWIGLPEGEEDRVAHLRAAPPAPPEM
ncbi:MAG TPA: serine hydrolase domain-containing protein, partial [Acidimicrobiales bacterium]